MSFSLLLIALFCVTLTASLELGLHCDFADLCSLGTRNDSTCAVGQKFLIRVCPTIVILLKSSATAGGERSEEAIFGFQFQLSGALSHPGGEGHRVQPSDGHHQQANL